MNKEDKELQKHLIDEMMKVYKTNPDVMIYMEALMKKYEEKEQEIDRLNNIINGMETFFKYAYDNEVKALNDRKISVWTICLDKLKELKENK